MKIDKNDFITLSDNIKYLVVSKVIYKDITYFYLVEIVDTSNIKIVTIDNDILIEVKDRSLFDKILLFMIKDWKM